MRILMAHNRYLVRGGEDESTDAELALLRAAGHQADLLEADNRRVAELGRLATAARTLWSREAYREVERRLAGGAYDVVHVQNSFPLLSPSILHAARAGGAAVVQSLRNYRLLCLNGYLFRDGRLCHDCLGRAVPWPGVRHRCYRGSLPGSATVAGMVTLHRALGTWRRCVDRFVAPSDFTRQLFVEAGFEAARIVVKPNFVAGEPAVGTGEGGYLLFVGRLSSEKGLGVLLEAVGRLDPPLPLKVIGEGAPPEGAAVPGVEWLGRRPLDEVYRAMGEALAVVVPSVWYETFGRIVVEAYAAGTPVVASDQGAVAELVDDGVTGYRFRAGDPADLAVALARLRDRPEATRALRLAARRRYEERYTGARNLELLLAIYRRAVAARDARTG
ncbi:Glycosyl transferase 4-like domain-containing protein [Tistlia consotensis]|uniref:Glycosyl transferase 4-like domain-containing protein n=1 Tax=Tistlia consotensis USBA 355 TaxID=560819 RepID=A0A1Y6BP67_9PROT|nr:glycosyltransferase [Tistlia consotensis]SMF21046.1 Glycosyl transferase 4-like domain-containing protein [Tistlia consotensis USBA 355]SNR47241.1 Glycosyl transferase 4-like domain-containing protein [Tistlia consotensis]